MTIRIGQIDYANCTPIFSSLATTGDCDSYKFIRGVPSELNRMLRRGEIDICPASSIEYAKFPENYLILPELSISSIGAVKSVLLFSRVPLEGLDNQAIGLTSESDTSANLLKIILAKACGFTNSFHTTSQEVNQALARFPALLLIGDTALRAAQAPPVPYVYDLGDLWYSYTKTPFVFALWLISSSAAKQRHDELLLLKANLLKAKLYAYDHYGNIAAACSELGWMGHDDLVTYWQTISYELSEDHFRGVEMFFSQAYDLGLLGNIPPIRLFV